MSVYRDQLAAALEAARITGETGYAWLGRRSRSLPRALVATMDASQRRDHLVTCVREELYASFYCHGRPVPARWGLPEPVSPEPLLASALSEANTGRGGWEPGWTIERVEGAEAVITMAGRRARIPLGECRTVGGPVRAGAAADVGRPKELPSLSPGFYTALGDAVADRDSLCPLVRVYWNVGRSGAPRLVRELTSRLNQAGVPFRLKVADHRHRFDRCDSAVLYLHGETFASLREGLLDVAAALATSLRARVPAFTLELAPGVGLAEDVEGEEQSFGSRRCALLAEGIVRAHEQGVTGATARLDVVAAQLAEDHVSIDAPYLEPRFAGTHVL